MHLDRHRSAQKITPIMCGSHTDSRHVWVSFVACVPCLVSHGKSELPWGEFPAFPQLNQGQEDSTVQFYSIWGRFKGVFPVFREILSDGRLVGLPGPMI